MPSVWENRPVSTYVMEILGLNVGEQSRLLGAKLTNPVNSVVSVGRTFKHIDGRGIRNLKFCLDEEDGVVYVLGNDDLFADRFSGWQVFVGETCVHVSKVVSTVRRGGIWEEFANIPNHIKVYPPSYAISIQGEASFHLKSDSVSLFVSEYLDFSVGDQSNLIMAKGLILGNHMKLIARVLKSNQGPDFLLTVKMISDYYTGSVYVKVASVDVANIMVDHGK